MRSAGWLRTPSALLSPSLRNVGLRLACLLTLAVPAQAGAVEMKLAPNAQPEVVFDQAHDRCGGDDMADINARAFRDASGQIVMFALYDSNRALRGKTLDAVSIDCHVTLASHFDPDPAHHDDRNFLAATWTKDGQHVAGLVHQEYHADQHGRCSVHSDLGCWYNMIVGYRSDDGGKNFVRSKPFVVAAAPFRQSVGQGHHRGFFNPSNIFSDGKYEYFFAATTGWSGQPYGACLFRSATPENSGSWRAFDGRKFSVRYDDPYARHFLAPNPCQPIAPFIFPVGAVIRLHGGGWIAVFQAARNADLFPVDGFYYATSKTLLSWGEPRLLLAGKTLYSDLCRAAPEIIAYPSLLDPTAKGRNFDDGGPAPFLYYAKIEVKDCATGERQLVRQKLMITRAPDKLQ